MAGGTVTRKKTTSTTKKKTTSPPRRNNSGTRRPTNTGGTKKPVQNKTQKSGGNKPTNRSNSNSGDRFESKNTREKTETQAKESTSNVEQLTKGIESNLNQSQPPGGNTEQAQDPRAGFFKDPQRGQKLDQAQRDLDAAKEGNHRDLESLREQQDQKRTETLSPAQERANETQAQLEKAEADLSKAQEQNRSDEVNQKNDHAEANRERLDARGELKELKKPGEDSAAQMVDKMDGYEQSARDTIQRNKEFQRESKETADALRSDIKERFGDQLSANPELNQDLNRFLAIDNDMRAENLTDSERNKLRAEKSELRKKLAEVKDSEGTLNRAAGKLDSTQRSAKDRAEHTEKRVEDLKKKHGDTLKKATELYGNEPGLKGKVDRYREAKKRTNETSPEGVAEKNAKRLSEAQSQLDEAKTAKGEADRDLDKKTDQYDKTTGAQDKQALAEKQKELVSELEGQVKDLSTIKESDLSEGISRAPGTDYGRISDIKLDGDKLTYKKNGSDMTASSDGDGGLQIEGTSGQPGNDSSVSVARSKDEDGKWRTDQSKIVKDSDTSTQTREFTRFDDGSSKKVSDYQSKTSDSRSHSETIRGADGSEISHGSRRDASRTSEWSTKKSPPRPEHGGKQDVESHNHSITRDGSYENTTSTFTNADGTQVHNSEDVFSYEWADKKENVEGASWLWKSSPQNLRNAIGDDAKYSTVKRSSTITGPDGSKQTNASELERWTSADGKRNLEAQRGQKGLPDTWTYSTKDGDQTHSQTFIKGSEDTSVTHEYTDRDGFRVNDTEEDFQETAAQIKEHTGKDTAESGHTVTRTKEEASLSDIEKLAKDNPELAEFMKSDDFKRFREAMGDEKFALALRESEQTLTNGRDQNDFQLAATGADGHSLVIMSDGESHGMRFMEPGEDGYRGVTLLDGNGNRMQANNEGQMQMFDSKGVKKFSKDLKKFTDAPGKIPHGIRSFAKELPHDLSKLKMFRKMGLFSGAKAAPEMGNFMKTMKDYDSMHSASFGRAVDMLGVGLSTYDTYNNASDGDWGGAIKSAASGFRDVGGLSKATGQGFKAGSYAKMVNGVEKAAKPWEAGAVLKSTSRVGQLGKALGVAGAVFQAGEGVYDMTQGRWARGGLGMTAAGGTALAIWGGASWAGPVGWGVAALATAGIYTIDYVNANAIAEPVIPLR